MHTRLPRPWKIAESSEAYWVEAANGARFAYCYFDERAFVGTGREERLTRDLARRVVANIVKLGAG
jgi:hypothetical protein